MDPEESNFKPQQLRDVFGDIVDNEVSASQRLRRACVASIHLHENDSEILLFELFNDKGLVRGGSLISLVSAFNACKFSKMLIFGLKRTM